MHIDPKVARDAGFHAPIPHGARDYDHTRMRSRDVRFSAPVFPGGHIETQIRVDNNVVSDRARRVERDVVVLDHGRCLPAPSSLV